MIWQQWVLVALFVLNALVIIARIGKPRPPLDPHDAIAVVILNGLLIWMVTTL